MLTMTHLPKAQGEFDRGVNPTESPAAREAIVEGYRALLTLKSDGYLAHIAETLNSTTARVCDEAIAAIEDNMSPNLLATVLPAYTRVRFATDRSPNGNTIDGQLRDGAWGLYPDRNGATERRITTTGGWEFFLDHSTVFTYFEVLERG
jgi:hypothetical protein